MNRQDIDILVKTMNVDTATKPVDVVYNRLLFAYLAICFKRLKI